MADLSWITDRPIAHRGLHDLAAGRPENSMAAFRAAVAHGYAIECDLQLSADSVPVVYHDDTLDRLTDQHGPLKDRPAPDTGRKSPFRGPVRPSPSSATFSPSSQARCRSSWNSRIMVTATRPLPRPFAQPFATTKVRWPSCPSTTKSCAWRATWRTGLPRGLVAEGDWRTAVTHLTAILRLGLHFLSYDVDDLPTPAPWIAQRILGMPLICWTVRTEGDRRRAARWSGQMTFEGFLP